MAIKIKRGSNFVYRAYSGFLSTEEKKRADKIYSESKKELEGLYEELSKKKIKDILERWYKIGKLIRKLLDKFDIKENERKYFWVMMYDIGKEKTPDHIKKFSLGRNDFRLAYIMTEYSLEQLKKVGSWSLWREIVGSEKINKDERVARWVADILINDPNIKTRDDARPLLKKVRNRLKHLETKILSDKELINKLEETR